MAETNQYREIMAHIYENKQAEKYFVWVILLLVLLVSVVLICCIFFKKIPAKAFPILIIVAIAVIICIPYLNKDTSKIKKDMDNDIYLEYIGEFEIKYFSRGNDGTTVIFKENGKERNLTIASENSKNIFVHNEGLEILYSGKYSGRIIYAPESLYVVDLIIE